ncbi:CoA binding domain protein [Paraburkholderia unamae]|uniref:acetate--CoA ligase family protein n=1 Tax=Paraburkholderia unamae TaxID=219649 RepID=UPI001CAC4B08|nr:acetate--CoA ligase family protein [Paraburkholderia unamae]CAG9266714.1 CoA binding domain protein [Paraburkholderia unamae]
MTSSTLSALFDAKSVAVIGASSDPDRIGGRVLRFLRESGYQGTLFPINRSGSEIQGLPAYPSILDTPEVPDQAIIVVPTGGVESALRDAIQKGVKSVVVLTAGFAEINAEGRAVQDRMAAMCKASGVRMVGPNSLGLLNVESRLFSTFSVVLYGISPKAGNIALATQSGAFGSALYGAATLRGMGFSKIVATGNEADVDVAEAIDYLAEDPGTKVIMAALESAKDGQKLRRALLKAAKAQKPVIIMKVGRSELGAAAAATHTGSLAGNDAAYDAVFAECGAYRAQSQEAMLDIAYLISTTGHLPVNNELGVLTSSGGIGVMVADACGDSGLTMPALPEAARTAMLELLPFAVAANPLDVTAQITSVKNGTVRALDIMLSNSSYGTTLAYLASAGLAPASFKTNYEQPFTELKARHPERDVIVVTLSVPEVDRELEKIGIPVFNDATRATLALGAAATIRARWANLYEPAEAKREAYKLGDVSTEALAKEALAEAGLPVPQDVLAINADAAVAAADAMGYPVVLKIVSPQIVHKTEVGGVVLNVKNADAVRAAHQQILDSVHVHVPDAQIDGILVCPMIVGGTEMILGVNNDATFGPMILVGAGGVNTELYKDVSLVSAPLTQARARQAIDKVKATALLKGWRGSAPKDMDALVTAMVKLSDFAMNHPEVMSVDVNPLVVREASAAVLDAVIIKHPEAAL